MAHCLTQTPAETVGSLKAGAESHLSLCPDLAEKEDLAGHIKLNLGRLDSMRYGPGASVLDIQSPAAYIHPEAPHSQHPHRAQMKRVTSLHTHFPSDPQPSQKPGNPGSLFLSFTTIRILRILLFKYLLGLTPSLHSCGTVCRRLSAPSPAWAFAGTSYLISPHVG